MSTSESAITYTYPAAAPRRLPEVEVRVKADVTYAVDSRGRFVPAPCEKASDCEHIATYTVSGTAVHGTANVSCCMWHLDAAVADMTQTCTAWAEIPRAAVHPPAFERCPQCGTASSWALSQHSRDDGRTWMCGDCLAADDNEGTAGRLCGVLYSEVGGPTGDALLGSLTSEALTDLLGHYQARRCPSCTEVAHAAVLGEIGRRPAAGEPAGTPSGS